MSFRDVILRSMMSFLLFMWILLLVSVSSVCANAYDVYCDVDGYNQTYCRNGCCGPKYHQFCCTAPKYPYAVLDAILMAITGLFAAGTVYTIGFFCIKNKVWTYRCYRKRPYRRTSPIARRPRGFSTFGALLVDRTQASAASPLGQGSTQTGNNQTQTPKPGQDNKTAGSTKTKPQQSVQGASNLRSSPPQPKKDKCQDEKLLEI